MHSNEMEDSFIEQTVRRRQVNLGEGQFAERQFEDFDLKVRQCDLSSSSSSSSFLSDSWVSVAKEDTFGPAEKTLLEDGFFVEEREVDRDDFGASDRDKKSSGLSDATEVAQSSPKVAQNGTNRGTNCQKAMHQAEQLAKNVFRLMHFEKLPNYLKDNEHLHFGHRPELQSFTDCFRQGLPEKLYLWLLYIRTLTKTTGKVATKASLNFPSLHLSGNPYLDPHDRSIFSLHTETGNIWSHLLASLAFILTTIIFYWQPLCATCQLDINPSEKLVFLAFFLGAIICFACSTLFHTLSCHSEWANTVFARIDYAGISFLIVGSSIPWLYYGFYCHYYTKVTYATLLTLLGVITSVLTMWERFNLPDFRVYRALTFVALAGLSATPIVHYIVRKGFYTSLMEASMQCTFVMAALSLVGALLYAARIPERFVPGRCDIWFHSHQLFHVLIIAAAFVHFRGISLMAEDRLRQDANCLREIEVMS